MYYYSDTEYVDEKSQKKWRKLDLVLLPLCYTLFSNFKNWLQDYIETT